MPLQPIKVRRTDLIERIKQNLDAHRDTFLAAQDIYRQKMIEELDRMIIDAKAGHKIRRAFLLPEPEDHTDDYNRVIDMFEMCVDDTVEIDEREFAQYVRDDWGWKAAWTQNTASYAAMAG